MAARRISARKPDVIVLDVLMPGIDGIEYCAKLKRDPQTRDIPVVLLTGSERTDLNGVARRRARAQAVQPARAPRGRRASRRRLERRAAAAAARRASRRSSSCSTRATCVTCVEVERQQRALLNAAYHDTVVALAGALESKDTGTRAHSRARAALRGRARAACAPELLEGSEHRVRLRAPRRRQDRHSRQRAAEAGAAVGRRAAADRDAHDRSASRCSRACRS